MSQRFQPLERENKLDTDRLLWPERSVIVEYRDAIGQLARNPALLPS